MKIKFLLIALLIAIISMSVVSASSNDTQVVMDDGLDVPIVDTCSFNNDVDADVNNTADSNPISYNVDDVKDVDAADLSHNSHITINDISPSGISIQSPLVDSVSNIVNSVSVPLTVHKNTQDKDKNDLIRDLIGELTKDKKTQQSQQPTSKKVEKVDKKVEEVKEEPLPETGIPILPLLLVLFVAVGLYRRD